MNKLPLLREALQPRLDGIQSNLVLLTSFGKLPLDQFEKPEVLDRVVHNLRLALEGVFNLTSHVLSRFPGARETEYKRMGRKLGELGVVDKTFADTTLVDMAGYRNCLTHFYAEIKPQELYAICQKHLVDIETFLHAIKKLMVSPEQFDLTIE